MAERHRQAALIRAERQYKAWAEQVERGGRLPTITRATPRVKRFIAERQGDGCKICGLTEWLGEPIMLVFDHINGDHTDWRIENCRLICSNCDAQQPIYKNRNNGNGRHSRRERYASGASY